MNSAPGACVHSLVSRLRVIAGCDKSQLAIDDGAAGIIVVLTVSVTLDLVAVVHS